MFQIVSAGRNIGNIIKTTTTTAAAAATTTTTADVCK